MMMSRGMSHPGFSRIATNVSPGEVKIPMILFKRPISVDVLSFSGVFIDSDMDYSSVFLACNRRDENGC
jgi:hypothetical protein